jgi:hypothetical protein
MPGQLILRAVGSTHEYAVAPAVVKVFDLAGAAVLAVAGVDETGGTGPVLGVQWDDAGAGRVEW